MPIHDPNPIDVTIYLVGDDLDDATSNMFFTDEDQAIRYAFDEGFPTAKVWEVEAEIRLDYPNVTQVWSAEQE